MKNTIVSLTIFFLLFISCIISHNILINKLDDLNKTIIAIENHINNNRWDTADDLINRTIEEFKTDSPFISFIVSNEIVENIEDSLEYISFYISEKDKFSSLFFSNKSKMNINSVIESQKINLKNIF
ncbi:hypothetical protein SH2C18_50850 [Clostridium sediminicola]|uniref:DUF4363 family protein n=1 Tax=Clostridium sediminicola TaxID=3114879 RepID=UPI0031F22EB0